MPLSSLQLEAFLAVAQTLNFTKAAEQLHITQSALSQRVIKLEEELETSLFIRDRAGIKLTEKAQDLVRFCLSKNSWEEEFLSGLKGPELAGTIRIGGFSSVMNSIIVPSLSSLFSSNAEMKLHLITDEVYNLEGLLRRGEIDYLITTSAEARDGVERIRLGEERNVLAQKKNYEGPEIYLDHDEDDLTTTHYLKLARIRPKQLKRRYLDDIHGLIAGVRYGMGRAVIPKHLLRGERDIEIVNPGTVYEIPVFLCFYAQPYYTKLHQAIVETLKTKTSRFLE